MKRRFIFFVPLLALWFIFGAGNGQAAQPSHTDRLSSFEGPQSCTPCHPTAAKEVANSLHYIQAYEPKFLVGWEKGKLAGQALTY